MLPLVDEWRRRAACLGLDPSLFHPERVGGEDNRGEEAKAVCVNCPVRVECLDFAVRENEDLGIWGGTGTDRRRALRRVWLSGDILEYQRRLVEESAHIGRVVAGYPDERPDRPAGECVRCGAPVRAGKLPVDRNGPGAQCGKASTYNKGCRCEPCSTAKQDYSRRQRGPSPRGEDATIEKRSG